MTSATTEAVPRPGDTDTGPQPRRGTGGSFAPGRRALLFSAAAATAATTLSGCDVKISLPSPGDTPTGGGPKPGPGDPGPGTPSPGKPVKRDKAARIDHVIRRMTYGPTPGLREEIEKVGLEAWIDQQLDPMSVKDPAGDAIRSWYPMLRIPYEKVSDEDRLDREKRHEYDQASVSEFTALAVWSKRQLLEIMTDLFFNHFNIASGNPKAFAQYQFVELMRKHAVTGRFTDLLIATSREPDMLRFLTLLRSTKDNPNENYAREVMELHTVGVDGGYTEDDVRQGALLFSGWGGPPWGPKFIPKWHHVGPLKVMDFRTENATASGGLKAQAEFLRYLARHPKTAQRLAHKIAVRFVADDPPKALVDRMAKVYLDNDTRIAPMLRVCLTSDEFFSSPSAAKVRRPFERLVAAMRVFAPRPPADGSGMRKLYQFNASHRPFGRATPDGYPDVAADWTSPSAALEQFKAALGLASGRVENVGLVGPGELLDEAPADADELVRAVARRVLFRDATKTETKAAMTLLSQSKLGTTFERGDSKHENAIAAVAALLTLTPSNLAR